MREDTINKILKNEVIINNKTLNRKKIDFNNLISYDENKICYK